MFKRERRGEWFLSLPSLVFLTTFFLIPTLILVLVAFRKKGLYGGLAPGWSLDPLFQLVSTQTLFIVLRTWALSFIATCFTLLVAIPVAYGIAKSSPFWKRVLLVLLVVPSWSSFLIRVYAWKALLHPEGFLKKTLQLLNLVTPETTLLYNNPVIVVVMVYTYLPFAIVPITTAAQKFNWQLFEAALDLGCTRLQAFFKIFLPGISRGISTALIMVFIPFMGAYVIPDLVGGTHSEMLGNKIAQKTLVERNFPEASSLSLLLTAATVLPLLLLSLSNRRKLDLKIERGLER